MKGLYAWIAAVTLAGGGWLAAQDPATTEVRANVTLAVENGAATGVTVRAHVEFLDYYGVRSQAVPFRDSTGRWLLDAKVETVAVIAIYPPPPKPVVDLSYRLGVLPAGEHSAAFRMNGKAFAEIKFKVGDPPPPVQVSMQAITGEGGTVAKARVAFPDGYWVLSDPGVARRDGAAFAIDAKADRIYTLVPPSGPTVFEPEYPLGMLEPGDYAIHYRVNGALAGVFPFKVPAPAVPRLEFINVRQGEVSVAAEVGVWVPPGTAVADWGEVARDGSLFKVALKFGPATATDEPVSSSGSVLRNVYTLGIVEAGNYRLAVNDAADGRLLGSRDFVVGPSPPPPPPPVPLVAYLRPGQDAAGGWFVEVGLVFPRPGMEIKDWGVPARDGNLFRVAIVHGAAPPPVLPYDPLLGGVPVDCCPAAPADEPPTVVDPAVTEPFRVIGGWPSRLVRHRYSLGLLEAGDYGFVVNLGGRDVAKCGFTVPVAGVPGPVATLEAPPLTVAGTEPYAFRILFDAAAGWQGDPGEGVVKVTGPNGFSAAAKLVSSIPSMDPLGRLYSCSYGLAGPGGSWDAADNGFYQVWVDPKAVVDRNGRTVPRPCIGGFAVRIAPELPPPPPGLEAKVAVAMRDGRWYADVAFENSGGWFAAEWGEVRLNGSVFAAGAVLRPLPPGSLAPIPDSFAHSYVLGSPPPGSYSFVFRSSVGHLALVTFEVPGVAPPSPVEAWAMASAASGGAGMDDDGDGWPNFAEYCLGMRPLVPDEPALQPKAVERDGRRHLALEFRRASATGAATGIGVEVSRDLVTWIDAGDLVEWVAGTPEIDGTEMVEVIQRAAVDGREWPYMRLRVDATAAE